MMKRTAWMMVCLALATACGSSEESASSTSDPPATSDPSAPAEVDFAAAGLEPLPAASFQMPRALLGRRLFHDPRLSGDGTVACASCHSLDTGGAEHRRTSAGIGSQVGPINSPTVLNSGLNFVQFWDGRAASLVEQAAGPVGNPMEMAGSADHDEVWSGVVARVGADEGYVTQFREVFGERGVTEATITEAIAEYESSLLTPSRYDAFLSGDRSALTAQERAGLETFVQVGCTACHRGPGVGGTMYQRMGLVRSYFELRGGEITEADRGRFNVTHDEADMHRFKVPLLRNIALTAPYFHDGSQETLEGAVRIMGQVQLGRDLSDEQVRSIVTFLNALTGELPAHARMPAEAAAAPTGETAPTGGTAPTGEAPAAAPAAQ